MKKVIPFVIASAIMSWLIAPPAVGAANAGSKCNSVNSKTIDKKINLVCVKSGSKLKWTASTNVTTYATGPTGRMVYRIVRDKQQRLSSANDWLKADVRKETDFDPIRVAAYKSISELTIDPKLTNIEFEFFIQASYPKEVGRVLKAQAKKIATKFSPILDTKMKLKLILLTEKDKSFIDGELKQIVPNVNFTGILQNLSSYGSLQDFYSRAGTGGGTAGYLPESKTGYYLGHTSSLATLRTFWPQVAPHEMAHVLQGVLAGGFEGNGYGEGDPRAKWHGHLIEGSANTIGMALGFENLGWYSDEMDLILRTSITDNVVKSRYPIKTIADAVFLMKEIEKREPGYKETLSYSAGQIIWEYFIGKYGFDKFVELMRNVPLTESFNENLEKTIGLDRDEFYEAAAPYLLATWKRLS
jgi:hypothetical protein